MVDKYVLPAAHRYRHRNLRRGYLVIAAVTIVAGFEIKLVFDEVANVTAQVSYAERTEEIMAYEKAAEVVRAKISRYTNRDVTAFSPAQIGDLGAATASKFLTMPLLEGKFKVNRGTQEHSITWADVSCPLW